LLPQNYQRTIERSRFQRSDPVDKCYETFKHACSVRRVCKASRRKLVGTSTGHVFFSHSLGNYDQLIDDFYWYSDAKVRGIHTSED
jgi:hypothetical protein